MTQLQGGCKKRENEIVKQFVETLNRDEHQDFY